MGVEIERKFLVNDHWRDIKAITKDAQEITQGYLPTKDGVTVRVRIMDGKRAALTVKGPKKGISCPEFEYRVPVPDAEEMLRTMCGTRVLRKIRCRVKHHAAIWELDVFRDGLDGLVLAEIELKNPDQKIRLPRWIGKEVSEDTRYSNHSLAIHGLAACPTCRGILAHAGHCSRLIPVKPEPDPEPPCERCCFCRRPTSMWTVIEGRSAGEQVACCEHCSKEHTQDEVPSKKEWCDKERELTPRFTR